MGGYCDRSGLVRETRGEGKEEEGYMADLRTLDGIA